MTSPARRTTSASRPGGYTTHTTADGETVRTYLDAGENPPAGVIVTYRLVATPDEPLTLTFRDADGEEIRVLFQSHGRRSATGEGAARPRPSRLEPLRLGHAPRAGDQDRGRRPRRRKSRSRVRSSLPGEYSVTLTVGDTELTQPFRIVTPHNIPATEDDLKSQHDLLLRIHRADRPHDEDDQSDARPARPARRLGQAHPRPRRGAEVATAAETLRDEVLEMEKTLLVPELRSEWEAYNYGVRLLAKLIALSSDVALGDYRPTDAAVELFDLLQAQLDERARALRAGQDRGFAGFQRRLAEAELTGVFVT